MILYTFLFHFKLLNETCFTACAVHVSLHVSCFYKTKDVTQKYSYCTTTCISKATYFTSSILSTRSIQQAKP